MFCDETKYDSFRHRHKGRRGLSLCPTKIQSILLRLYSHSPFTPCLNVCRYTYMLGMPEYLGQMPNTRFVFTNQANHGWGYHPGTPGHCPTVTRGFLYFKANFTSTTQQTQATFQKSSSFQPEKSSVMKPNMIASDTDIRAEGV